MAETFETIMNRLLSHVDDSMDKREGSIIYDALAPAALEIANMETQIDTVYEQTFASTATDDYLDLRVAERGLAREAATYAKVQGAFTPAGVISSGDRFSCGDYNYAVDDAEEMTLICETSGSLPNGVTGTLIPINYINGLETASITEVLIPGEDEETDEVLRQRYWDSINNSAYGGNIADYIKWTTSIDGVYSCKVVPTPNNVGGTVGVYVLASDYGAPSQTLIDEVQTAIDPEVNAGKGYGLAPIGHVVTVSGVTETAMNLTVSVTYQDGWDYASAQSYIEAALNAYYESLIKTWADNDNLIVRVSGIETALLGATGILDVADTTINGDAANLTLGAYEIPVLGTFNGN